VTATPVAQPIQRTAPDAITVLVVGLIGAVAVLTLITAGVTFFALAVAFPIALPIAQQFHVAVSATDIAIAEQFASVWYAFAGLGVASFAAAVVVMVAVVKSVAPRD
jgi:hypothetical protein